MTTASGAARRGLSRAVVFTGIALGTFVTVTAYVNGYRPPAAGLAAVLAGFLTWLLLAVLAVTVLEVLRRHHRAIGRHGWRYGKRGAIAAGGGAAAAARAAAARSRPWRTRVLAALRPRWAARGSEPLMFRRTAEPGSAGTGGPESATEGACPRCGWPTPDEGPCDNCKPGAEQAGGQDSLRPTWSWGLAGARSHWPAEILLAGMVVLPSAGG